MSLFVAGEIFADTSEKAFLNVLNTPTITFGVTEAGTAALRVEGVTLVDTSRQSFFSNVVVRGYGITVG